MKRLVIITLLLMGCAGAWSQVGGPFQPSNRAFSVDLPQGWMKFNEYDGLLISRDGIFLQSILIERITLDEKAAPNMRNLRMGMDPMEAAEAFAQYLKSRKILANLTIIEKGLAKIDGRTGFKLVYTFMNHDGLTYKGVYYGVLIRKDFIGLRYLAVQRHYFEQDFETFDNVVRSFKVS